MGNLKFGDISTKDLDLVIQSPPLYDFPEKDAGTYHIPGRNGDLIIDTDSYKNTTRTYSIASVFRPGTDFIANSERLIAWLTMNPGYHRLEDSYDPEVYRLAMFRSKGSLQNYYDKATILNVTFECKPQRYLKIGERLVSYSFDRVANLDNIEAKIENPTLMKSLPEITLKNIESESDKVLMFNVINYKDEVTSSITLTAVPEESITFDSEHQLVYTIKNGSVRNLNKYVNLNGKSFPKLDRKQNKLQVKKYSEIINDIQKYEDLIANDMDTVFARYLPFETVLESKQSKAKIISYDSLKNLKTEVYDAETYQGLALDNSEYFEFESFNDTLSKNCFMIGFNTDRLTGPNREDINIIYINSSGTLIYPNPLKTIDDTIMVFYNQDTSKYSIIILRPDESGENKLRYGAFMILKDTTESSYDSTKIIYMPTLSYNSIITGGYLNDIYNGTSGYDIVNILQTNGLSSKTLATLASEDNSAHDIIISLYPTKVTKQLDISYSKPSFMDIEIVYSDQIVATGTSIDKILYKPTKTGYFYKASSEGSGILSGIVGTLIGKLFNKTGWSKINVIPTTDAFEQVDWSTNKKQFILGSLLSANPNYTVARYYFDSDNMPQYKDITLANTYELNDKGEPLTDAAGNKINKVIKNKLIIVSANDDLSEITSVKAKYSGYYRFNYSDDNPTQWTYYEANDIIPLTSDYNKNCKSANTIDFLVDIPDYRLVADFPDWLDPIQILLSSNGTELIDTGTKISKTNRMNAPFIDFKVKELGWYWYDFLEDDIVKRTIFFKLESGDRIGIRQYDPSIDPGRDSSLDFVVYYMDYKTDSDDFPIHTYEYMETTGSLQGTYCIIDQSVKEWSSSKIYHKGDLVWNVNQANNNRGYICIVDNSTQGTFISSEWEDKGFIIVNLNDYKSDTAYSTTDFCIHERKVYKCITAHTSTEIFNPDYWTEYGNYIKNIGFRYLTDVGAEEEIPFNIPPAWIKVSIVPGEAEDFSDTTLEFREIQNGLYKWDTNTEWVNEIGSERTILTTAVYKTDTSIFYLENLPEYDPSEYNDLYDLSEILQSTTGNPEKVYVKAVNSGYYKIGSSTNYEYHNTNDILQELNVNQDLHIIYLDPLPMDESLKDIKIDVIPRWWSL